MAEIVPPAETGWRERWPLVVVGAGACGLVADDGRALGVQTDEGAIAAEAVVLALDGFGADRAMVAEHLGPVAAAAHYFGSPTNTGEGIRWGIALGAATEH